MQRKPRSLDQSPVPPSARAPRFMRSLARDLSQLQRHPRRLGVLYLHVVDPERTGQDFLPPHARPAEIPVSLLVCARTAHVIPPDSMSAPTGPPVCIPRRTRCRRVAEQAFGWPGRLNREPRTWTACTDSDGATSGLTGSGCEASESRWPGYPWPGLSISTREAMRTSQVLPSRV
jgi:hypothetical protein